MGRSTLGAGWNDFIVDEIIWHWNQHNNGGAIDSYDALSDARLAVDRNLDQAIAAGEVNQYASHIRRADLKLIFSIEFPDNIVWRGEFKCEHLVNYGTIGTEQDINIDTNKTYAPPPTSCASVNPKTMNIPVDPVADYDRAMRGVG